MSEPKPEVVLRDGIVYRLVRLPDGQKKMRRGRRPALVHRDPGDETKKPWAR